MAGVVELTDEEGRVGSQPFPATVLPQLVGLRYEMWNPLTLPWYRYSLTESPLPTDADLVEDLAWFPRSEEHIPDWYPRA